MAVWEDLGTMGGIVGRSRNQVWQCGKIWEPGVAVQEDLGTGWERIGVGEEIEVGVWKDLGTRDGGERKQGWGRGSGNYCWEWEGDEELRAQGREHVCVHRMHTRIRI